MLRASSRVEYIVILLLCFPNVGFRQSITLNQKVDRKSNYFRSSNYTLNVIKSGYVSVGVFATSGNLLRTISSNEYLTAGIYTRVYDGYLDDSTLAPNDAVIKYSIANIKAVWEGSWIGNTSVATSGTQKIRSFSQPNDVCFDQINAYLSNGYNEAYPANFYLRLSDLNAGKTYFGNSLGYNNSLSICTDGKTVYTAMRGEMGLNTRYNTFVWGMKNKDKTDIKFTDGLTNPTKFSGNFSSVIGLKDTASPGSMITCIRVQKKGNYLFITRSGIGELLVINKITGAITKDYTIIGSSFMTIDKSDNLWLAHDNTIEKFEVNIDGSLLSTGVINKELTSIGQMAASPDGSVIAVADLDNQQIKGISTATGTIIWSLGSKSGYLRSSTVTNLKYDFKDAQGYHAGLLAYDASGNLYVGDPMNWRTLIYSASRNYQSSFGFPSATYNVGADINNPTRVFAGFLEFAVDYSKPYRAQNESWRLKNNWGAQWSNKDYDPNARPAYRAVTVFGHTYSLLRGTANYGNKNFVVELVPNGVVRRTGQIYSSNSFIAPDGNLYEFVPNQPPTYSIIQHKANGVDGNGNIQWDGGHIINILTSPFINPYPMAINGNKIGVYDISARDVYGGKDYHVGFADTGTNIYSAITAPGTDRSYSGPFPSNQYFDNGNGVILGLNGAGGTILTVGDKTFFTNYHGENYLSNQTNKWNIWDGKTGLMLGQFGVVGHDLLGNESPPQFAGNTTTGQLVTANGITYLYQNDESNGIHRWRIDSLNSILIMTANQSVTTQKSYLSKNLVSSIKMQKFLFDKTSDNWKTSSNYNKDQNNYFYTKIGNRSADKFKSPSFSIYFKKNKGSDYIASDLGNNLNLSNWVISGNILLYPATYNEGHDGSGQYLQVLDTAKKVIANFYIRQSPYSLMGNNSALIDLPKNPPLIDFNYYQPFAISYSQGTILFKYGSYSASSKTTVDAGADMKSPTTLRFYFFTNNPADNYARQYTIKDFTFTNDKTTSKNVE